MPCRPEPSSDDALLLPLDDALSFLGGGAVIAVAFSGGRDSTALLHAASRLASDQDRVVALHVHHGLNPDADAWVRHGERTCEAFSDLPGRPRLRVHRLTGSPADGESVEAWARAGRHAALQDMAREEGAQVLLLAHHRRDQAETFLLQALRGGGVRGLASMPAASLREGLWWKRPWLGVPRERIEAYVAQQGLPYVDDASNADSRFARNRLRLQVWPALSGAFVSTEASLATSAAWMQQAADVLDELADTDLAAVQVAGGLDHARFMGLTAARRTNLLRSWVQQELGHLPSAAMLQRLAVQLPGDAPASWYLKGGAVRRYRGLISIDHLRPRLPVDPPPEPQRLCIAGPGEYSVAGWKGRLVVREAPARTGGEAGSLPLSALADIVAKPRGGGERFQSRPGSIPRGLKKQFQALSIPEWERDGPLLFRGDDLLFVPGLGVDARAGAWPGSTPHDSRVDVRWEGEGGHTR